jgi:hypothetical protein
MKEIYFLNERDYLHFIRLLSAAWDNGKPRQLECLKQELYGRFHFNAVVREEIHENIT